MHVKAQKWGNSLAVRMPKAVADAVGIKENDALSLEVEGDAIKLTPSRQVPTLAQLLKGITPQNRHSAIDFGPPRGREAW
jgi:antitoxin MazE